MTRLMSRVWLMVAAGALVVTGCGDDDSSGASTTDPDMPSVEVAADGACIWSGGDVTAGVIDIRFVNNSSGGIVVNFSLIAEGATLDDVIASAPEVGDLHGYHDLPALAEAGPITRPVDAGSSIAFGVTLTAPGDYAVSCPMTEPTINAGVPTIAPVAMRVSS